MTVLQSLDGYYDRMAARGDAELPGYSREKISFAIVVTGEGEPLDILDLRNFSGKTPQPNLREVPAAVKRTSGISPNVLWDKTSYALGRTAGDAARAIEQHDAFKFANLELLTSANDEGLVALRRFLETWTPQRFDFPPFHAELLDTNVVFRLDGDHGYIHERDAAKRLVESRPTDEEATALCLVTGAIAPISRLHPTIKGVQGAQTSGAALVSFNLDAFTSYGKEQGDNAPCSKAAAFRYGAALNRMLDRNSRNRLSRPIGDATVVFWADASGARQEEAAQAAEEKFADWFEPAPAADTDDDQSEAVKLRDALTNVAEGRPQLADPRLSPGVRFHVLGLAPNAARLSIRYWLDDDFSVFAQRLSEHYEDLRIEPAPWRGKPPSIARVLVKTTALQDKFENIPPLLAGEVARAALTGARYPRTLLSSAIMRLRAGDDPSTGWHALAIRAVLARDQRRTRSDRAVPRKEEIPVSLDRNHANTGYQLGRLFAVYELAQRAALGGSVKATIRDKYFGAAAAAPASIFPLIITNGQNHLSKVRKEKPGWAYVIEKELEQVVDRIKPALPFSLPRSLSLENQGEFAIGYYHQRKATLGDGTVEQPTLDDANEEGDETND
ncbi:MAG: type I-C CRISPR-associated protein Cas8c/Csd1 [Caulobacteraceae bacterium]